MTKKQYLPAIVKYIKLLAETTVAVKKAGADTEVVLDMLKDANGYLKAVKEALKKLENSVVLAESMCGAKAQAFFYKDIVMEEMEALRTPVDELEKIVDRDLWPVPSYAELAFEV